MIFVSVEVIERVIAAIRAIEDQAFTTASFNDSNYMPITKDSIWELANANDALVTVRKEHDSTP